MTGPIVCSAARTLFLCLFLLLCQCLSFIFSSSVEEKTEKCLHLLQHSGLISLIPSSSASVSKWKCLVSDVYVKNSGNRQWLDWLGPSLWLGRWYYLGTWKLLLRPHVWNLGKIRFIRNRKGVFSRQFNVLYIQ